MMEKQSMYAPENGPINQDDIKMIKYTSNKIVLT